MSSFFKSSLKLLSFTTATLIQVQVEAATNDQGLKFLEENKSRPGVITLKSGLQYKILKKGKGKFSPKVGTSCSCHYVGTTPTLTPHATMTPDGKESDPFPVSSDGSEDDSKNLGWKEFDSSYKRGEPTSFAPNQVIKGWTEAMQLMVEGDKWEMYIPSELGYGDGGSGDKIKGGDVLIFRMEMIKINGGMSGKKRVKKCDYGGLKKDVHGKEGLKEEDLEKLNSEETNATDCDLDEIKAWFKYNEEYKSVEKLEEEVKKLEAKSKETMKKGMREKIVEELKMMKSVWKGMKKVNKGKKTEL